MAATIVKTLPLSEPITWGSLEVTELNFSKPKARHFRQMAVAQDAATGDNFIRFGTLMDVAAAMCGVVPAVIDELSAADMFAVIAIVQGFMPAGQKIG